MSSQQGSRKVRWDLIVPAFASVLAVAVTSVVLLHIAENDREAQFALDAKGALRAERLVAYSRLLDSQREMAAAEEAALSCYNGGDALVPEDESGPSPRSFRARYWRQLQRLERARDQMGIDVARTLLIASPSTLDAARSVQQHHDETSSFLEGLVGTPPRSQELVQMVERDLDKATTLSAALLREMRRDVDAETGTVSLSDRADVEPVDC